MGLHNVNRNQGEGIFTIIRAEAKKFPPGGFI